MFEPKLRLISYKITKPSGVVVHIPVQLNERGLICESVGQRSDQSVSSEFIGENCLACDRHHQGCKAERAIGPVVDSFDDLHSTDEVSAEVETEGRIVALKSPAPRVLASLMGLLMASSGCPRLIPFRAMALFHQPFATAEENVVRAAGFWLMRSSSQGTLVDNPYEALQEAWEMLENVNRHVSEKLLARCSTDVSSNGVAYLDVLAKIGTLGLESVLEVLHPAFSARTH